MSKDQLIATIVKAATDGLDDREIILYHKASLFDNFHPGRVLTGDVSAFLYYRGLVHTICKKSGVEVRRAPTV